MERIATPQVIEEMIENEEELTATREDGLEESFIVSTRNEPKLKAFLSIYNQQEGRRWIVKDRANNIIKTPELEIHKPVILRLSY